MAVGGSTRHTAVKRPICGRTWRVLPRHQWESWHSEIRKKCRQDRLKVGTYIDDPDLLGPRAVHAVLNETGTNVTLIIDGKLVRLSVPEGTPDEIIFDEARRIIDADNSR